MATFRGSFKSNGSSIKLAFVPDIKWIQVLNQTQLAASQTTAVGVKYYWQADASVNGDKYVTFKSNAAAAANLDQYITSNGFYLYDDSIASTGALQNTITAISTAAIPVVTNTGTNGLTPGSVVQLINVAGTPQFGNIPWTVGYNTLSTTTFSLDYAPTLGVAGTTGGFRLVNANPAFYPPERYITLMESVGVNTVIQLSVTHSYTIGQVVRINVPDASFGMPEINGLTGTIVAIDTTVTSGNTITVSIDSSSFTAFEFPAAAAYPFTPAAVVPVGQDSAYSLANGINFLGDATVDDASAGLVLTGGANCPGGANNDVMVWIAGTDDSTPIGNFTY